MNSNEKAKQFLSGHRPSATAFDEWVVDASVSDLRSLVIQSQVDSEFTLYLGPAKIAIQEKLAKQAEITADKNLRTAEDFLQVSKDILAAHHIVVGLTRTLRSLTWALLAFTVALFLLTAFLCYDAYQNHATDNMEHLNDTKPQKAKP